MAKRKAKKTGISNAMIVKQIKAVTTGIKRRAKTGAVKSDHQVHRSDGYGMR